jgi:lysophospholipase L1-like esterase
MSNVSTTKSTTTVIVSTTMVVSPNVSSSAQTEIVVSTTGDQWFDHYHNRIAYFKKENIEIDIKSNKEQKWAKQIVLLGDSLTEGFNIKKFFPDLPVVNRGIVSDHTVWGGTKYEGMGVLYRITPLLLAPNPSHIFLLIGTNDVGGSLDVCEKNYREILKMLKENFPEAKVVIQTLPPTRGRYARLNDAIREFNERLKNLAKEFKLDLIDLHSLFVDENGELKENFTRDGLHLTEPAYEIWKTEIEKVLKMK